uniref:C2H2-type domain-containing protein n=1 Tax=Cyclopterus lumpus TaxID=8103 RepID=A0A8C2XRT6_CYCLU
MAAVDPSESPKRQKSAAEEVNTSGEKTDAVESGCSSNQKDEPTHKKPKKGEEEEEKSAETAPAEKPAVEEVVENEADREGDANSTAKPKKCRLVCKECGKRFTRRETFNLHRHFHAHEDELTPLTCKECGLTFQHLLVPPKKATQTKTEGRFKCAECEMMFPMVDKLRDHSCCNVVEKPYHCPLCRQEFQFKVSVTKHMMLHSQDSIFTCQECGQTFPNSMALRYHQRCHAALKPYECPECGLTFKYSSLLHQHQYLHTGQKPFRCPECGKRFAFAQNMKAHCRQHRMLKNNPSAEQPCKPAPTSAQEAVRGPGKENAHQSDDPKQPFNCPLCPQTYLAPANLRVHMLVHEAEHETLERTPKPPKENNCRKGYSDETQLQHHMLSHNGDKPHK